MTPGEAKQVLVECFEALTDEQRGHLAYHAEQGTEILCGELANWYYYDGVG